MRFCYRRYVRRKETRLQERKPVVITFSLFLFCATLFLLYTSQKNKHSQTPRKLTNTFLAVTVLSGIGGKQTARSATMYLENARTKERYHYTGNVNYVYNKNDKAYGSFANPFFLIGKIPTGDYYVSLVVEKYVIGALRSNDTKNSLVHIVNGETIELQPVIHTVGK